MPKAAKNRRRAAPKKSAKVSTNNNEDDDVIVGDSGGIADGDISDYEAGLLVVDPGNIADASEDDGDEDGALLMEVDDDNEDGLVIDDSYEEEPGRESESYDPLSLVSVGLDDDDDDYEDDDDIATETSVSATCEFCKKIFAERKHLTRHIKSVHQKACSVACQYCGRILSDQDSYKRHINTVHKVKVAAATALEKTQSSFPQPVLSVTALAKECPDCGLKFATKTTLNLHRLKAHVVALEQLPCPTCKQECPDLTAHMRRFHDVQGIVCPHCANIFSKKCTLNRHIEQVHLNIQIHKPATCSQCGKLFSKKGHLDRHIKIIHKGIKDYSDPCPYCKKVFTTRASLEPHIAMVHEGIRRKCPICNKVLSDLNKHMRTVHHTYRRKAKIPKEAISGMDSPAELEDLEPQIYGAKRADAKKKTASSPQLSPKPVEASKKVVALQQQGSPSTEISSAAGKQSPRVLASIGQVKVAAAAVSKADSPPPPLISGAATASIVLFPTQSSPTAPVLSKIVKPALAEENLKAVVGAPPPALRRIVRDTPKATAIVKEHHKSGETSLETIKQELGLSDVITLQKITKPLPKVAAVPPQLPNKPALPPPPKLTYHGPPPPLLAVAVPQLISNSPAIPSPLQIVGIPAYMSAVQYVTSSAPPSQPLLPTQTFGSITLTPLPSKTATMTTAVNNGQPSRPVMVKITGKPKAAKATAAVSSYCGSQEAAATADWLPLKPLKRERS